MKITKIAGCIASLLVSASAFAYPTWNVNDVAVGGVIAADPTNTVDVLNGRYSGSITQTVTGSSVVGTTTYVTANFQESGVANLTSYFLNNVGVSTGVGYPNAVLGGYSIYGVFSVAGSTLFATSGGVTSLTGAFSTGTVSLYLDRNKDSVSSVSNILSATTGADDLLIGSASLITNSALLIGNIATSKGSYNVTFGDFALTSFGSTYWDAPVPFHKVFTLSGENEAFNPALSLGDYTGTVYGDASVNAELPEPASLALVGLGLLGVGFARRRKAVTK